MKYVLHKNKQVEVKHSQKKYLPESAQIFYMPVCLSDFLPGVYWPVEFWKYYSLCNDLKSIFNFWKKIFFAPVIAPFPFFFKIDMFIWRERLKKNKKKTV